jgi:hypothetical protein
MAMMEREIDEMKKCIKSRETCMNTRKYMND